MERAKALLFLFITFLHSLSGLGRKYLMIIQMFLIFPNPCLERIKRGKYILIQVRKYTLFREYL